MKFYNLGHKTFETDFSNVHEGHSKFFQLSCSPGVLMTFCDKYVQTTLGLKLFNFHLSYYLTLKRLCFGG